MDRIWRTFPAVVLLGALLLTGIVPARAHNFCQVVSVTVPGGFAPTVLDAWAFATVPAQPTPSTVRQIVVCPAVVLSTPVFVTSPLFVVDPPPDRPQSSGVSAEASAPAPAVSGVLPPVTVRDLAERPDLFDRQVISIEGTAVDVHPSRDSRGTPYAEIRLEHGGASVTAVAWGTPAVNAGQRIRVTGNFYARAPFALAAGSSGRNVLEAEVIETLP